MASTVRVLVKGAFQAIPFGGPTYDSLEKALTYALGYEVSKIDNGLRVIAPAILTTAAVGSIFFPATSAYTVPRLAMLGFGKKAGAVATTGVALAFTTWFTDKAVKLKNYIKYGDSMPHHLVTAADEALVRGAAYQEQTVSFHHDEESDTVVASMAEKPQDAAVGDDEEDDALSDVIEDEIKFRLDALKVIIKCYCAYYHLYAARDNQVDESYAPQIQDIDLRIINARKITDGRGHIVAFYHYVDAEITKIRGQLRRIAEAKANDALAAQAQQGGGPPLDDAHLLAKEQQHQADKERRAQLREELLRGYRAQEHIAEAAEIEARVDKKATPATGKLLLQQYQGIIRRDLPEAQQLSDREAFLQQRLDLLEGKRDEVAALIREQGKRIEEASGHHEQRERRRRASH